MRGETSPTMRPELHNAGNCQSCAGHPPSRCAFVDMCANAKLPYGKLDEMSGIRKAFNEIAHHGRLHGVINGEAYLFSSS